MEKRSRCFGVLLVFLSGLVLAAESGGEFFYTANFYTAIGLILIVLAIIGFFVWLFIRGPRNKWDQKKGFLHGLGKK